MIDMLTWVKDTYTNNAVSEAVTTALSAMHACEKTGNKKAQHVTRRSSYLEKQYFLVPIKEIQKLIESNIHTWILQAAIRLVNISVKTDLVAEIKKNWT